MNVPFLMNCNLSGLLKTTSNAGILKWQKIEMVAHAMHCCNYMHLVSSLTVGPLYTQRDKNGMDNHP